jgi:hypothetical protein
MSKPMRLNDETNSVIISLLHIARFFGPEEAQKEGQALVHAINETVREIIKPPKEAA